MSATSSKDLTKNRANREASHRTSDARIASNLGGGIGVTWTLYPFEEGTPKSFMQSDYWALCNGDQQFAARSEGKHVTTVFFGKARKVEEDQLEEHLSDEVRSRRTFVRHVGDTGKDYYHLDRADLRENVSIGEGEGRARFSGVNLLNRLFLVHPEMEGMERTEANMEVFFMDDLPERYQGTGVNELVGRILADPGVPEDMKILVGISQVRAAKPAVLSFQQDTLSVREDRAAREASQRLTLDGEDSDDDDEEYVLPRKKRPLSSSPTGSAASGKKVRKANNELRRLSSYNTPGILSEVEEARAQFVVTLDSVLSASRHVGEQVAREFEQNRELAMQNQALMTQLMRALGDVRRGSKRRTGSASGSGSDSSA